MCGQWLVVWLVWMDAMVDLIFNVGISTCYVGFIRREEDISFGHDEGHVRCFF